MLADDNAVNQFDSRSSANAGDGIEAELAFLAGILDQAGDAEVPADELATIEILREEGAITAPRPRYQRRGPALTQVAAVGLATFPAALAPLPAMAATPLPPSLAIAMATRPPAPPAGHTPANDLFAFSRPMQDVRARAQASMAAHLPGHPVMPRVAAPNLAHALAHPNLPVVHTLASQHGTNVAAANLKLNPRLEKMFQQQRHVAVTTKRQLAATFYQVSHGDSLYSIAADLLGSGSRWREIAAANQGKIGAGYLLKPGQKLVIPTPRNVPDVKLAHFKGQPANSPKLATARPSYMVSKGDSLYTIAARRLHNPNRWREIVSLNKALLNGKTVIYPNQWLLLPSMT